MEQSYTNVCRACRIAAHQTQEVWAETLGVSVDTVKGWECNLRVPSNRAVSQMVDACQNYYWAYVHLQQTSAALDVLPDASLVPLPQAAIRIVNCVMDFADKHRDRQLLKIAEDGIIDEDEQELYGKIVTELQDLVGAAFTLRYCLTENERPSSAKPGRPAINCCGH